MRLPLALPNQKIAESKCKFISSPCLMEMIRETRGGLNQDFNTLKVTMGIRKILIGLGVLIFALLFFGLYKLSNFTLFDDEFEVIESIRIPNKGYIIKIYYISSNATSQSYIQIRKIKNGVEDVLKNYERFNHLDNYLLTRDTLVLSVRDLDNIKAEIVIKKFPLP